MPHPAQTEKNQNFSSLKKQLNTFKFWEPWELCSKVNTKSWHFENLFLKILLFILFMYIFHASLHQSHCILWLILKKENYVLKSKDRLIQNAVPLPTAKERLIQSVMSWPKARSNWKQTWVWAWKKIFCKIELWDNSSSGCHLIPRVVRDLLSKQSS